MANVCRPKASTTTGRSVTHDATASGEPDVMNRRPASLRSPIPNAGTSRTADGCGSSQSDEEDSEGACTAAAGGPDAAAADAPATEGAALQLTATNITLMLESIGAPDTLSEREYDAETEIYDAETEIYDAETEIYDADTVVFDAPYAYDISQHRVYGSTY